MDGVGVGPESPPKDFLAVAFDANDERQNIVVNRWSDFKEGDIIFDRDHDYMRAIMVGWRDNSSVWRYESYSDDVGFELVYLPPEMGDVFLPAKVSRLLSAYSEPKPEHQLKNMKWEWCFWCDAPHCRCPRCDVNSCSCGCGLQHKDKEAYEACGGECPEEGWWAAQNGEEYKAEREARPHPERDRLIKFIQMLSEIPEEKLWERQMICDPFKVMEHARWHGLDVTFEWKARVNMGDSVDWKITLNSIPTDEARPVYYPERVNHRCTNLSKPGKSADVPSTQE